MYPARKIFTAVLILSTALVLAPLSSSHAYNGRCSAEIDNTIKELAIPAERIQKVFTVNIYAGGGENGGSRLERVEGWVSFNDCKGNLVIDLDAFCRPQGNYTTYACQVPGVKHY